jgi:ABC-type transport system involved in Fe-S cluster assembly fused permease/ATPase subunit
LLKGKTTVYCAHRLSSIINVDTIHVLANGKVVEEGSHHELINKENSVYKEMWHNYLREADDVSEEIIKTISVEVPKS